MRWLSYADLYNLVAWCHIKRSVGTLFNKHFLRFWKQLVTPEERSTRPSRLTNCVRQQKFEMFFLMIRRPPRSSDVSRVTEVWICAIDFNAKSPLTSQLHALTSHELTWREDSVFSGFVYCLSLAGTAGSNSTGNMGTLSIVSAVCCQVEVSATGRSLFQRSPVECGVYDSDRGTSWRRHRSSRAVEPWKINHKQYLWQSGNWRLKNFNILFM
jgi:hypothetical protein